MKSLSFILGLFLVFQSTAMDSTSIYWFGNSLLGSGGISRITEFAAWKAQKKYPLYSKLTNAGADYSFEVKQSWDSTANKDSIRLGPTRDGKSHWNYVMIQSLYRSNVAIADYPLYMKKYIDSTVATKATPIIYDDWWGMAKTPTETEMVLDVCKANGVAMSPIRSAFTWCLENYPNVHYLLDYVHAASPMGMLVGSCCWATLFAEPTFGFDKVYDDLSSEDAHLMQQVAWNFVTLSPYRELQPWSGKTVRLVKSIVLTKKIDTLEQYTSRQLTIQTTFNNDSVDVNSKWAIFSSLNPEIAKVSYSGVVMGKNTGLAKIVAMREWKYDTLNLWISPTKLTLDSIRIAPRSVSGYISNGFQFTATASFRDKTLPVKLDITPDAEWISGDTAVFVAKAGTIVRTSAKGGSQKLSIAFGGMSDSIQFKMIPEFRYLNRVKFMDKDTSLNVNWNADTGHAYDTTRGYGWLEVADVKNFIKVADWQAINFKDSNFLRCGFVRPRKKVTNQLVDCWGTYKFKAPDGDYIIKAVIGHHNPINVLPCSLLFVNGPTSDTLATFQSQKTSKLRVVKDTVRVFGEDGLKLGVFGPIQYLVVCTSENVDIDSIAFDSDAFIKGGNSVEATDGLLMAPSVLYASPNPFSPEITLLFNSPQKVPATLTIFDVAGKQVRTLLSNGIVSGTNRISWNGTDAQNRALASGIYFARLNLGDRKLVQRLILKH